MTLLPYWIYSYFFPINYTLSSYFFSPILKNLILKEIQFIIFTCIKLTMNFNITPNLL